MEEEYDQYELTDSDGYEEVDGSEPEEEEEEQEDPAVIREQQEFLKRREQLKKEIRQKMKKERASHSSQSQHKNGTVVNDNFGSFFGPSKPVIAARVLEESRSIRETKQTVAKQNRSGPVSTSTSIKTCADQRQHNVKEVPKVINKVKALKEMRDYSFLLSDDADLPETVKEEPTPRKVPVQNSGHSVRPAAGNPRHVSRNTAVQSSASKPARLVARDQHKNSSASRQHVHTKIVSKEPPPRRSKPDSVGPREGNASSRNGSGRPLGRETLPTKGSSRDTGTIRPPAKLVNPSSGSKRPSAKPISSSQNQYSEHRRVSHGVDQNKPAPKQVPSRLQPMKPASARDVRQDPPKRKPLRRDDPFEEDDVDDPIAIIRGMYGYNPNKFKDIDNADDRDMEVGFDMIQKEERRSRLLGKKEDQEQLRLIEEEEKRERMRKKQKMRH